MVSERLAALAEELAALASRGIAMMPEAVGIIGALVNDIAEEAEALERGAPNLAARSRPDLTLIEGGRHD